MVGLVRVSMRCHCGNLQETLQLRPALPWDNLTCHCNKCRHVSGAITYGGIAIVDAPASTFQTKLVKYASSERVWRYFCATCGSSPVYYNTEQGNWAVTPGAIEEVIEGDQATLERSTVQEFVVDTVDGGFSWCLPNTKTYREGVGNPPGDSIKDAISSAKAEYEVSESNDKLLAKCHCGQVELYISRPDDGGKWEGNICICRSCRRSLSQTFVAWLSNVPYEKITWRNGLTFDNTPRRQTTRFQSSDHAHRDFCSRCGASVLWSSEKEPGTVDIAAGLLRAREGVLARSWIKWNTRPFSYIDDAVDKELVAIVEKNLSKLNNT